MLKVLIIDDDEIVLLVERKILQRCGIDKETITFKCGEAALEYLKNQDTDQKFLILLDINMPVMNGWDFLRQMESLERNENIFVIMVTSSIDRYDKQVSENYNSVIGFIEKPITAEDCKQIKNLPEISSYF
ncbi:response regulator [Antarcticibacterium arcticum]|uniref:Response regulator n=1 Tax=Antarcticibacterium arcticum TaxID=2585771 RepID=A0A5B8YF52_9FLAO|nr:response regulator [Antarcticibacterium arcticum]QED36550.1 response regulator [Antarcticibacterium arcticum]